MAVLIISDIHANYCALKAVLDRFGGADEIWCLGDLVEFGPCPAECVDLVRGTCRHVIKGNHDHSTAERGSAGSNPWAEHAARVMNEEDLNYLRALPTSLSAAADGTRFFLVHGSPQDHLNGKLEPDSAPSALARAARLCPEGVILCGHSHVAMILDVAGKQIVNAGTIGQPRDGDYRAQCMLLDGGRISFERVEYDLDALASDYEKAALPDALKEEWLGYTRAGIVPVHGLQLGPFSAPREATA